MKNIINVSKKHIMFVKQEQKIIKKQIYINKKKSKSKSHLFSS